MPDQERAPRSVNPADVSKPANPGFGELLASCAAANAVSTPPSADEARPIRDVSPRGEETSTKGEARERKRAA